MVNATEYNWVQQAKQGDRAAIGDLYHRYWRAARAAAYGVIGDLSLAEDAASEALCAALQGLGGLDDPGRFGPWLRTIVVRSARRVKTGRAKLKGPEDVSDAMAHAPDAKMDQQKLTVLIRQAVGRLPDRLREAVSLFYFEGYDLKEAALFLDVPIGTLKRRLHEARLRLRDAAAAIIEGRRPMDPNQDRAIQKLRDLFDQESEPARDALFDAVREAMQLHPFPRELFAEFWQRRMQKKRESHPACFEQVERDLPKIIARWGLPSSRVLDVSDPVGRAAQAIRTALPQFVPWQPDPAQMIRTVLGGKVAAQLPPGFAEGVPGRYMHATRARLVQNDDGSVSTPVEVMKAATTMQDFSTLMHKGSRLSDALHLWWLWAGPMDLHAVEDLLRCLATTVAPGVPVRFSAYDDALYRAALRMHLDDIPVPGAVGGVSDTWPGMLGGTTAASVVLHVEAWAMAQSGKVIELADLAPMMEELGRVSEAYRG